MLHRERLHSISQPRRAGRNLRANSKDENLPINKIVYHTGDASALRCASDLSMTFQKNSR